MRLRAILLGASLFFATSAGHANGRFPLSQRFFQDQDNPDRLYLSATFGILLSQDRGQNWYHVCEGTLTPDLLESDILFEVLPGGAMLAGLVRPLALSTDCGCSFESVLGQGDDQWVIDIAKAGGDSVIALVRSAGPPLAFRLERSSDAGRTWSTVSELPADLQAFTLDAAPSDPMRIYVSALLDSDPDAGIGSSRPALLVSGDAGMTWQTKVMSGASSDDQPYIAAVDPSDANRVFLRSDNWTFNPDTEIDEASDALFVTEDGGETFRELLRRGGKLFGFALSPDGTTVLAGYGDPRQAARDVFPEELGIYRASTADYSFTHALNTPISCLTWNANGLYACVNQAVGHSPDGSVPATLDGFARVLTYDDVRGPLACNSSVCLSEWQQGREDVASVCDRLEAMCDIDTTPNVLSCTSSGGSSAGGSAGAGGTAGSGPAGSGGAGTGGSSGSGAGAGGSSGSASAGSAPSDSSSCGCRFVHPSGSEPSLALLGLILALGARRACKRARCSD